ncbi:ankyrin repeat domain-containing protein [Aquimarina macrocephali]|uniref:ankyrin repeat domain-containing protein n=1 Tax=Aquimarina macrocephali TaxID=666563 RepID=UPI0004646307|nr:ankyrin repeat domain-containing protein [Aquimarina macrocephali]
MTTNINIIFSILFLLLITPNIVKSQDFTALEQVIREGKLDVLKEAVKRNNDLLSYQNSKGYSLLILATYNNQLEIVNYLISQKININLSDKSGNTALMGVAFQGHIEIARTLIKNDVKIDQQNYNGATALHFAATFGNKDIADLLIEARANKTIKNSFGDTPYDVAIKQANTKLASILK